MDRREVATDYARYLTDYLAGGPLEPLLTLFCPDACVERYVYGELPRRHCGLEQIEESLIRLPPVGGSFQIQGVRREGETVHAWFYTRDFPYPLRGRFRFDLDGEGRIVNLYIAAKYDATAAER